MAKVGVCLFLMVVLIGESKQTLEEDINEEINNANGTEKSLLRKRRYLVFPSGSSLQLVYCLTVPSVGMGTIFTLGHTAALAWELPDKAEFILDLKNKKHHTTTEAPETTTLPPLHHDHDLQYDYDSPHPFEAAPPVERLDKPSRYPSGTWIRQPVDTRKTYHNPFLVGRRPVTYHGYSPAKGVSNLVPNRGFRRNSITGSASWRKVTSGQAGRPKSVTYSSNHRSSWNKEKTPVSTYIHPVYHQHYRRTRRDLYGKIEKLFTALSKDGKSCLLKAICEVSQVAHRKGSFMEEILKAIFRIKPHDNYPDEDEYDTAANKNHNCTDQYPTCDGSVWTNMLSY